MSSPADAPDAPDRIAVSVVVPVRDAERTLRSLLERLEAALAPSANRWELVLVDDDSADSSWRRIEELAARDARVTGVALARNAGQHGATLCGAHHARGALIVTLDDDLQQPPEEVPRLIEAMAPGVDLVYGSPRKSSAAAHRTLGSRGVRALLGVVAGRDLARATSFRCVRRELFEPVGPVVGLPLFLDGALTRASRGTVHVPVESERRAHGESGYGLRALGRVALAIFRDARGGAGRGRRRGPAYEVRRVVGGARGA